MVFWQRKTKAAPVVELPPDPNAWLPADTYLADPTISRVAGPYRFGEEVAIVGAFAQQRNEDLKRHGIHASQVDGGLDFSVATTPNKYDAEPLDLILESVIQGLGIRYLAGGYAYDGITRDGEHLIPRYITGEDVHLNFPNNWLAILAPEYLADMDAGINKLLAALNQTLSEDSIRVTPRNMMSRMVLEIAEPVWLSDTIAAGWVLPQRTTTSGFGKHLRKREEIYIPQLHFEYLRADMPISYLLAATMPVYVMDASAGDRQQRPWCAQYSGELVPRFNITEVFTLRDQPIHLVLAMVGASKGNIMASASEY